MMDKKARWVTILLIFTLFFLEGAYLVPDTNEAHYLGKAARFWNPQYAQGDFLLSTPDAHGAFVWLLGWLTLFMPLSAVAWTGRIGTWFAMAFFWQKLASRIYRGGSALDVKLQSGFAILSAGIFVSLLANCHLAGEWVFGGLEAKSIAFVFVFWGLENLCIGRWNRVWILLGLASLFHVLVGGWTVVAALITYVTEIVLPRRKSKQSINSSEGTNFSGIQNFDEGTDSSGTTASGGYKSVLCLLIGGLISLPALIPALLLNQGADSNTIHTAGLLYVYQRLPHHLVLTSLPWLYIVRFALMAAVCLVLIGRQLREKIPNFAANRLSIWVLSSIFIAIIGAILSVVSPFYQTEMAGLLRFYWFRLSDFAVPMGVALLGLNQASIGLISTRKTKKCFPRVIWGLFFSALVLTAGWQLMYNTNRLLFPVPPRQCGMASINYAAWRDVCDWAKNNTPHGTVFVVPKNARTFTWYSERGTVVNWKDVPQNAVGLIQWRDRIRDFYVRPNPNKPGAYLWNDTLVLQPPARLKAMAKKYGAELMITNARTPIDLPKVYENRNFTVYSLQ